LEYRYSPKSKLPYIINELPLDFYVLGVAETYNTAPEEYVKALMVAARSYAYAHISKLPPTEKRMFDVYPTTVDQIYLGYNSELFMPRVAKLAIDTNGEMVTYKGNPVSTPYFSHSNGYTKNWKTKDRPWLKSVKAVYDKGKKMYGHGMGMSNNDAIKRAQKDGWTYDQILRYYYTSTTVEKIY
jgi:stage II sporulation protein D